ncbi:hypothetical protein ACFVWR_08780 [Leifsonia sp. NPDC058292]|uniref:hypothetical protein n=1 Tax=Leifsonia sp. NPDC058292 TaxID=3346428 RepID=UPI0036DD13B1
MTDTTRTFRVRWYWWLIAAVVLLVMVGAIVSLAVGARLNADAPRAAVGRFLHALVDGKAKAALALAGAKVSPSDVLLTDESYAKATNRIRSFSIGPAVVTGDTAKVSAEIRQGDRTYKQSFDLTRAGKAYLVFDEWKLKPLDLTTVSADLETPPSLDFTIAGAKVDDPTHVSLRALPGMYEVRAGAEQQDLYAVDPFTLTAIGFGDATTKAPTISAHLTSKGEDAIHSAVDAWIDGCAASTELSPPGCPFEGIGDPGITYTNVTWSMESRPSFSVDYTYFDGGWTVASITDGSVTASADISRPSDGATGTATVDPIPFRFTGVGSFEDGTAQFTPSIK